MLKYRALQFSVFVLLILSVLFLFNACNKDAVTNDESIQSRTDLINTQVEIQESYNAFSLKRQSVQKCDECYTNPLYYDIELESGRVVDYEGDLAFTFKVKESPFQYTTWDRNQILVKKNGDGNYSVSNLIYLADSTFYAIKKYKPLSINFTGVILEINQEGKLIKAFSSQFGQIVKMMDESEILRNVNALHDLKFRNDDEIIPGDDLPWWERLWYWIKGVSCPSADGKSHFWEHVGDWFGKLFENKGLASTNSTNFSDIFRHRNRGTSTSNWSSNNNNDGNFGYGGGNSNSPYYSICQDLDQYWNSLKSTTRFDYFEAISKVVSEYNVGLCDEQLYSNTMGCPINYYEILCNARYIDCLPPPETLEIDEEDIEDCIRDVLTPYRNTNLPKECLTAVKAFNTKYGLSINPFLLNIVMCGFEDLCDNPEAFNCEANKAAFFLRPDIQQIIADNAVIDPCNPDLTTRDIMTDYVNNNCSEGICTKPLEKVLNEIGDGKMHKTESFIQCKALNCLFDALWAKGPTNFCNLQDKFESDNKIIDLAIGTKDQFTSEQLRGKVGINAKTGRITIYFNPSMCISEFDLDLPYISVDFLQSAKTIIHESIHADFYRQANTLLPDGKTLTPINGISFESSVREFLNIICTDGDNITDQHEEMMTFWVNKIASDLWEFNNKIGNPEDYLYLAWGGIFTGDTQDDPCMQLFITIDEYNSYNSSYIDHVVENPKTKEREIEINKCINQ